MAAPGAANSSTNAHDFDSLLDRDRSRHPISTPTQRTPPASLRRMYSESGTGGAKTPATVDEGTPLLHSPVARDLEAASGAKATGVCSCIL